ncbi:MAG: hypothetical protein L6Q71_06785, partial [Planctomycetes bacterium]|nr:hypothetical protein [Planctomycetota bacterium]
MADALKVQLESINDAAIEIVKEKCRGMGIDVNAGPIPFSGALTDFRTNASILRALNENGSFDSFPQSVRQELLESLTKAVELLKVVMEGKDVTAKAIAQIDVFRTSMYRWGLAQMITVDLNYAERLARVANLERETDSLRQKLEDLLRQRGTVDNLVTSLKNEEAAAKTSRTSLDDLAKQAAKDKSLCDASMAEVQAKTAAIRQHEDDARKLLAESKTSNASVLTVEKQVKDFLSMVEKYKEAILATETKAEQVVEGNTARTGELLKRLEDLEKRIVEKLASATGISLFHSFSTSAKRVRPAKWFWLIALLAILLTSVVATIWITATETQVSIAFFIKLSVSIPIIFGAYFCARQYNKERRLEEEYSARSNISLSLVPFKDLLENMRYQDTDHQKFVMKSI